MDAQVAAASGIGEVGPVKRALGGAESVLMAWRADNNIFPLMDDELGIVLCDIQIAFCHEDQLKIRQFPGHMNPVLVWSDKFAGPVELQRFFKMKIQCIHITFSYLSLNR